MLLASLPILVFCLIFVSFFKYSDGGVDFNKGYKEYGTCNGEKVSIPSEWMPQAVLAAMQCMHIRDDICQKQCIAFAYPGIMKNGRIDQDWLKKESRKVKLSERNEQARKELLKGVAKCEKKLPKLESPSTGDTCPEAKEFGKCMEEEYEYACKGKPRPADDTSFLETDD